MTIRAVHDNDKALVLELAGRHPKTAALVTPEYAEGMLRSMREAPNTVALVNLRGALCWIDVDERGEKIAVMWLLPLADGAHGETIPCLDAAVLETARRYPKCLDWEGYAIMDGAEGFEAAKRIAEFYPGTRVERFTAPRPEGDPRPGRDLTKISLEPYRNAVAAAESGYPRPVRGAGR
jgi:hypothetical protein